MTMDHHFVHIRSIDRHQVRLGNLHFASLRRVHKWTFLIHGRKMCSFISMANNRKLQSHTTLLPYSLQCTIRRCCYIRSHIVPWSDNNPTGSDQDNAYLLEFDHSLCHTHPKWHPSLLSHGVLFDLATSTMSHLFCGYCCCGCGCRSWQPWWLELMAVSPIETTIARPLHTGIQTVGRV